MLRQVRSLAAKELSMELREGHHIVSVVVFGLLLLLLFSFALSSDPELMRHVAPGLFWLAVFFTSLLFLDHSFRREMEDGQWEGLLLSGVAPQSLYLGKMIANLIFILAIEVVLLPLLAVFYDLQLTFSLVPVLILGSLGVAALGTFYSGLTASFREGHLLLPILLFPMLVPLLLAAVKVMELALAHDIFGQQAAWFKLLIVFDTVFVFGSLLLSEVVFDR